MALQRTTCKTTKDRRKRRVKALNDAKRGSARTPNVTFNILLWNIFVTIHIFVL